MSTSESIVKEIEKLREELKILGDDENLTNSELLKKSQQLDRSIVEYYELAKKITG
ncbi:MAG: aspartyl-phosphate phosphatase Spo0E family protein [Syntrophomonas sp.]|nr:aspartyl-phosphate phosphatase Spo0E family protein [Syntrophomonas sp.]